MKNLKIKGIEMETHDVPYPLDVDPYQSQVELLELFTDRDEFVVVNDEPTGAGKTMSWEAPVLEHKLDTIAIYPTNTLISDQYDSLSEDMDGVFQVTSETLKTKRKEYNDVRSNAEVINRWTREVSQQTGHVVMLTNPDIFVMMCRDLYGKSLRWIKSFETVVVDEFHRADLKQQKTLTYTIDELYERESWLKYVVLLSATPELQDLATKLAMPMVDITTREFREFKDPSGGVMNPVMPPVDLNVSPATIFGVADEIRDKYVYSWCKDHRTVIMVDGVHEVEQTYNHMQASLPNSTVERIDGFYSKNKLEKLKRFDVLVSNSAVEVGVNFDVERAVFSGMSASSFLQRLGRLRNTGEEREAWVFVPKDIYNTLPKDEVLSRETFRELLVESYPQPRDPPNFDVRFAAPEALYQLASRAKDTTSDKRQKLKTQGMKRINRHFFEDDELTPKDAKRVMNNMDRGVLKELQWYRGSSSMTTLVYDTVNDEVRTYNLLYLLRWGDVEFYTESEFSEVLPGEIDTTGHQDTYCTFHGTIESGDDGYGRDVGFTGGDLIGWINRTTHNTRKPRFVDLEIRVEGGSKRIRGGSHEIVNDQIGESLCYAVPGYSTHVEEYYDLGNFFFVYNVKKHGDPYSVALGLNSLYLYCNVKESQLISS